MGNIQCSMIRLVLCTFVVLYLGFSDLLAKMREHASAQREGWELVWQDDKCFYS